MLDLTIKKTRVYNEIKEEGREEGKIQKAIAVAKKLLMTSMNLQEIAQITELPLEQVLQLQAQSDDT